MGSPISLVIADNHRLIRESLRLVLSEEESIQILRQVGNGPETIDVVSELNPDVVLLHFFMPAMDYSEVIQSIREKSPKTKILILNRAMDETLIFKTLEAGAKGYVSKDASLSDLVKAIQAVHVGELWVERKLISRFYDEGPVAVAGEEDRSFMTEKGLTPREQEVLRCLATGCTNKEIGEILFISEKTVKAHLNSIFRKLNVTRRLQAILYAINRGLT